MAEKPQIVKQYEQQLETGEPLYFDPVELDDIFHYYAEENMVDKLSPVLQLAVRLHPEEPVTRLMQAEYALNLGEASDCLQQLEPIFDEGNSFHCILRSGSYAKMGRMMEAIDYAEKALKGDDPLIAYDLGLGFMNADQPTVALRYYSRCLDSYPQDLRTLLGMVYCLNQVGSPEEIIQYADRCLEIDSFCTDAWMAKGGALAEQDKWAEAEECYDYALAVSPDEPDMLMMKANCCVRQDRIDEAIDLSLDAAQSALDRGDSIQEANIGLMLARLYQDKDDLKSAVETVWKSLQAAPTNEDIVFRCALSFGDFGETDISISLLRDLYELHPDNPSEELLERLGDYYARQDYTDQALAIYKKMVELYPSAIHYSLLAGMCLSNSKFHLAYRYLLKANEMGTIWQNYVLLAVCAHEMKWRTACQDNYFLAHALNAEAAKELLNAISPELTKSFEEQGLFDKAEQWRQQQLADTLQRLLNKNQDNQK